MERHHVKRIMKRFEKSGTVLDGRHFNTGRPKTGRSLSKEMIDKVQSSPLLMRHRLNLSELCSEN